MYLRLPPHQLKSIPFGLQHVLAMFVANIAPIMIRTLFAENCVAVVFLAAIILNLVMPIRHDKQKRKGDTYGKNQRNL